MTRAATTAGALLELARVSNLPTCFTNVLVGCVIGGATAGAFPWGAYALLVGAVSLLYVAGMILNDAVDAPADRVDCPARPIPSGRFSRASAFAVAAAAGVAGVAMLIPLGARPVAWGGALALTIVAYDVLHKRHVASVVLMGACRGLVYVVSAAALADAMPATTLAAIAGAMTVYIVVVTLLARREHRNETVAARGAELVLPVVALAPVVIVRPADATWAIMVGAILTLWLVRCATLVWQRPPRVRFAVMGWLAGICLVDAYALALLEAPGLALAAAACFVLTVLGHRVVLGS